MSGCSGVAWFCPDWVWWLENINTCQWGAQLASGSKCWRLWCAGLRNTVSQSASTCFSHLFFILWSQRGSCILLLLFFLFWNPLLILSFLFPGAFGFLLPSFSLLLTILMINFVCVVSPIVTVQLESTKSKGGGLSPSVNWLAWSWNDATSVWRLQIARFQFNVKLSWDKEKQTCCTESNLNHVCVSEAWLNS